MSPLPPDVVHDVYLAGPMQGLPNFNFPRFHAVTRALRANGHRVFSPAEKDIERHGPFVESATGSIEEAKQTAGFSLRQALAEDCEFICRHATCVVFLPGWETSKGAQAEHRLAVALKSEGMEIIYLHEDMVQMMEAITHEA